MATRMRTWVSIVGVGCMLIVLWLVPPTSHIDWFPGYFESLLTPERREARRIAIEARRLNGVIARTLVGDSLIALVRSTGSGTEPVFMTLPQGVALELEERLQAAIRREVGRVETLSPSTLVGVALIAATAGADLAFNPVWSSVTSQYFAGVVDGQQVCFVVRGFGIRGEETLADRTISNWVPESDEYPTGPLGVCGFYLAYGAPGPEIGRWLRESGAFALAQNRWMGERLPIQPSNHRMAFGFWRQAYRGSRAIAGEGCLSGRVAACRELVSHGRQSMEHNALLGIPLWIHEDTRTGMYGEFESWWMGELEERFGEERFRRFWQSRQGPEEAFLAAFGESMGEWTMRWAQARHGRQSAGPFTDRLSVLLTVLTVLACVGAAAATGIRRRI